ncbi:MAG: hypothetical protein AAGH60_03380 [Pseudomonadota bacterium]
MNDNERPLREPASTSDWVLGILFGVLVFGSAAALTYDFRTLTGQSLSSPFGPQTSPARVSPGPPPLPGREDQVRRYDPTGVPWRRSGQQVVLPGFEGDPDAALSQPMRFVPTDENAAIAIGRITLTSYQDFEDFLAEQPQIDRLIMHSPGGSVRDAMGMALLIRDMEIATNVPENGYCASSCPLAFAGGVTRTIGEDATIGVHQVFTAEGTVGSLQDGMEGAQYVSSQAQQLLDDMGVDPRAWIHAMATPPDQVYVFTEEELDDLGWRRE